MQTAVDYLQEHFKTLIEEDKKGIYKLLFEQAKEMEKQMIIDAHYEGASDETGSYMPQYLSIDDSITYYNDTYGSKESDETKTDKL